MTATGRTERRNQTLESHSLSSPFLTVASYTRVSLITTRLNIIVTLCNPQTRWITGTNHMPLGRPSVPQKNHFLLRVDFGDTHIQLPQVGRISLNEISFSCFGRNHLAILGSESSISSTSRSKRGKAQCLKISCQDLMGRATTVITISMRTEHLLLSQALSKVIDIWEPHIVFITPLKYSRHSPRYSHTERL